MTSSVHDLRVLVDNLDEYIHIPGGIDRLKKMILHLAVSGQLVPQNPSEGSGEQLYQQIQSEKAKLVRRAELKKQKPSIELTNGEIPFQVPESWKFARTGNIILQMSGGGTPSRVEPKFWDGDIPWASIKDLNVETYIEDTRDHITEAGCASKANLLKPAGSIFIGTRMGVGKIAISTRDMAINQDLKAIQVTLLDKLFFLQYFKTAEIKGTAGTTVEGITQDKLLELPFPLPPLAEQKRIVAKVDSLFALIDQLSQQYTAEQAERSKLVASSLAMLARGDSTAEQNLALTHLGEVIRTKADAKVLRQTILHLAVSGQLVPQDPSEGTGEQLYRQIQAEKQKLITEGKIKKQKPLPEISDDEIPFEIPATWKWTRFGQIGDFGSGSTPIRGEAKFYDGNINWFKSGELTDSYMYSNSKERITEYALSKCSLRFNRPGDILIAMYGATAGKIGLLEVEGTTNQAVCGMTPFSHVDRIFIFNTLLATRGSLIEQSAGAAQPNISKVKIINSTFPLPPLAEQKRIVVRTAQLLDLVAELETHLEM